MYFFGRFLDISPTWCGGVEILVVGEFLDTSRAGNCGVETLAFGGLLDASPAWSCGVETQVVCSPFCPASWTLYVLVSSIFFTIRVFRLTSKLIFLTCRNAFVTASDPLKFVHSGSH